MLGFYPVFTDSSKKPLNTQKGVLQPKIRKYSPVFKKGAVEQVRQPGVSCAQVARELGIGSNLLSRWQREADAQGQQAFIGSGHARDEEVTRLK
jgi:transposase